MKHYKDKGLCFNMDVTNEAIMDVRKQVHISTMLERDLTDVLNVLNAKEKEIEECLKELNALNEVPSLEPKI